jgi:oligopeptide/dipeptide ABC transporter ATP-binding protein
MLSVRNLRVSFRTEQGLLQAIDGVSFDVKEGEILGVVGESGSGKTVSLLAVMGLINDPNAVIEGSIKYRGRELIGLRAAEMRKLRGREIAMIFQDPMTALTPVYTIGWQIAEQILAHEKISKAAARKRAIDLLAEVNIPNPEEAVDRYPHQLSGGMRQRAVIAMALSCNPALLVADEPTTALDVTIQAQILELLVRLQKETGMALVLITHSMGVVAETAERVSVQYAGQKVEEQPVKNLFATPRHPYTAALLAALPERAHARRLPSIPGVVPGQFDRPVGCLFSPRCIYATELCRTTQPAMSFGALCHYPLGKVAA